MRRRAARFCAGATSTGAACRRHAASRGPPSISRRPRRRPRPTRRAGTMTPPTSRASPSPDRSAARSTPTSFWRECEMADDILALGAKVRAADLQLWHDQRRRDQIQVLIDAQPGLAATLGGQLAHQDQLIAQANRDRDQARADQAAAAARDPIHAADASLPLVLLPVRIETAYLPTATQG